MAKKIIWSSRAKNDLFDILQFWKQKNKSISYSKKLYQLFLYNLDLVSHNPFIGKPTNYKNIRAKIAGHFLLIYQIDKQNIFLITIWDNRKNPDELQKVLQKT